MVVRINEIILTLSGPGPFQSLNTARDSFKRYETWTYQKLYLQR